MPKLAQLPNLSEENRAAVLAAIRSRKRPRWGDLLSIIPYLAVFGFAVGTVFAYDNLFHHPWGDLVRGLIFAGISNTGIFLLIFKALKRHDAEVVDELRRQHLCVHCGYDLRGSSGICPECGRTDAN